MQDDSPKAGTNKNTPTLKKDSKLKSTGVVGGCTMLSRILGLVRDIVIAHFVGASASADAFFVAFKIPNFLRRLFAEGAFAQAFVPVLSEYQQKRDHGAVKLLVDHVAGTLGSTLILLTVMGVIAAPVIAMLFAPGFVQFDDKMALTSDLLRLTFPYLLLISLTAFAGSVLNSYGRFAVPAFTPILLNVSLISCAVFMAPLLENPVMALGWGVLIAGSVQLLFQLPFLARLHLLPRPRVDRKHEGVRQIIKLMIPALFGVSVSQINLLLDTVLASFLQTGSVSWLYYSDRLVELPLGIFGIAIATVILPSLSRQHVSASAEQFRATLDWALRLVCLLALPAALALFVLAEPLITTLFQYGAMTAQDVEMAAMSLRAYSVGLVAFMLIKVLAPGYYSRQDTKTPVKIGIWAMVANMVMNLILIWPLQHAGLALATSLSAFLNAGLLFVGLYRLGVYRPLPGWGLMALRLVLANAAMVLLILWLGAGSENWAEWTVWQRAWQLAILCVAGGSVYFVMLILSGLRLRHLRH